MMQKEVGERLLAKPKTKAYNALSVIFQYYTEVKKLIDVKRHMFTPIPKVDSVVIKITKKDEIVKDLFFETIVKLAFSNKRKMVINNLSQDEKYSKEYIIEIFNKLELSTNLRAEEISVSNWQLIVNELK